VGGDLFALENRCAHHGGPLCHGRVSGALLPSAPGEYRYGREGRVVTCPWHGWEYDLETGRTLFDDRVWVRTFEARWEDGHAVLYDRSCGSSVVDGARSGG
jgi:nitrite reductase (NADH) small subunit